MHKLERDWEHYSRESDNGETKRAFFAGARAILHALMLNADTLGEKEGEKLVKSLEAECDKFFN